MISLSQRAHGNLGSRKELRKGFLGATRHGVTGQDPAGSGGFAHCHPAPGTAQISVPVLPDPAALRTSMERNSSCLWVAKPCSSETGRTKVPVCRCCFLAVFVNSSCKAAHSGLGCPTRLSPSSKGLPATRARRWAAVDWALGFLNIARE